MDSAASPSLFRVYSKCGGQSLVVAVRHLGPKENEVHVVCCVHDSSLDLQHLDVLNTFSALIKTASHGETINVRDALKIWVINLKT